MPVERLGGSNTHAIIPIIDWMAAPRESQIRGTDMVGNLSLRVYSRFLESPMLVIAGYRRFNRFKNSSLVLALDLIRPSMQLVVVVAGVFWTPRITMQR